MATQPKKEPTEAEQYAAEEKARIEAIEAKKALEAADTVKPEAKPAKPKTTPKPAASRARPSKAKAKDRIEVYEQRGPKGLFKVTRNIETGETSAELIEE